MFRELNPSTLLVPVPVVLISAAGLPGGAKARPNALTVAWTGVINTDPPMLSISVRPERWSYEQIQESGEFVVNMVPESLVEACDYCGVRSGADEDKLARCGLSTRPAAGLQYAQAIAESPFTLSCKLNEIVKLGTHDMFIADIVATEADESLFNGDKLELSKANLVAYMHGEYYSLGKRLGFFGYSVAADDVYERRMGQAR